MVQSLTDVLDALMVAIFRRYVVSLETFTMTMGLIESSDGLPCSSWQHFLSCVDEGT